MASKKDTKTLVPDFIKTSFKLKQTLSQIHSLLDNRVLDLYVLMLLNEQDDENKIFAVDIQEKLGISKASVSNLLTNLEEKGFITRKINKGNKRKMLLSITESGIAELDSNAPIFFEVMSGILDELGYDNAVFLTQQISRLSDIFDRTYAENNHSQLK